MRTNITKSKNRQHGFTLLEVLVALLVMLVGIVAIAQLVPAALTSNNGNRSYSTALVLVQRELYQMIDQPLTQVTFTDVLGNVCSLGNPATPNTVVGAPVVVVNNVPTINFASGAVPGYSFTYKDPDDPYGTTYDVRWAVITTANAGVPNSKRFIIGARQAAGNGFFQPLTLDTMVEK
jgi:prepilin-type N-terminal cleavage/methylation domain-containing protein